MATSVEQFEEVASTWSPGRQVAHDVVTAHAPTTFAAMLDVPSPVVRDGDPLPHLWHWFLFPEVHAQSDLGADGHPWDGPLVPPLGPRRRMFGGGRLHVDQPLRCGERVRRTSEVASVRNRAGRSGPLLLVTLRHTFTVDAAHRFTEEQDIVYRPPLGTVEAPPPPDTSSDPGPPDADWHLTVTPDPVLLFRFSALTTNAHRIHYDRAYARDVEGHPELVVHGPLLALLLLELPRRHGHPRRPLHGLTWRARTPLYAGQHVHVQGTDRGDEATLTAGAGDDGDAVTGTATFRGAPT